MKQTGHIRIKDNKVYFEPEGLEKPNKDDYYSIGHNFEEGFQAAEYIGALEEYEISKKLIKVNNYTIIYEWYDEINNPNDDKIFGYCIDLFKPDKTGYKTRMIKNNTPCEAEIENNKAVITKIL